MNHPFKSKNGTGPGAKAFLLKLLRNPGFLALIACLMLGVGFFLGSLWFRSRSSDAVVIAAAPAERLFPERALVNINTADEEELQTLPGIGPVLAKRIVAYREDHGPFRHLYELSDVSGIGSRTYEAVMELITID